MPKIKTIAAACAGVFAAAYSFAQTANSDAVVVTATRVERPTFDLPLSIDSISGAQIQENRAQVNVSESLNRVPGTVVLGRETYAQEQQLTIRGFGARSQFGIRGIKLLADGIPASTPDGQGGTGLFDLGSAQRIEVLRGPFSALYGNHSGGVVQVFTEDGPPQPTVSGNFAYGSYDTWRAGLKFGGQSENVNYIGSLSRFETDGYRDWSHAQKDQFNAKLKYAADAKSSWTFVVNYLDQPNNLDPLGLTAAEVAQNRRQASPAALQFQTRRSLNNLQGGLVYENAITDIDTLRAMAYVGQRSNKQYLAIPLNTQRDFASSILHSGGVSAFDRDFYGLGLRWTRKLSTLTLTAGADYERAEDARKGYLNDLGAQGALKRDETNTVWQTGAYTQAEWQFAQDWSASAGLRYTKVSFDSKDHFICTTIGSTCSGATLPVTATRINPDDSGSVSYDAWTPAAGLLYRLTPAVNLYANAGRSFETPTFVELAYKPDGSSGLNFDLKPSKSNQYEIGMKAYLGTETRLNLALFHIDTSNEIVIFTNAGGRTTYQNAGDTQRRGIEISLDSNFGNGFSGYLAATYLEARFKDSFSTCTTTPCAAPNATVAADNRIPGVPNYTVYGELAWRYAPLGFSTALEARWSGKVYANDINTATADSYLVAGLRAGLEQKVRNWRFTEFARADNLFDEKYIGAVYVNDANSRFYAPAPERNYLVGASVSYAFR